MKKRLPSFFVVGAQKAGTTSLHDWLSQQPDVCLPKIKETNFFSDEEIHSKGIEWYLRRFPRCDGSAVIGEINPEYMFKEDALQRIKRCVERPKLIFIFRNILDRALSQYKMSVRNGYEDLSFDEALKSEGRRLLSKDAIFSLLHHSYMARGRYVEQVNRSKQVLPDAEFLFVKFDDLISDEKGLETYSRICFFIGVSSDPRLADRSKVSNPESRPYSAMLNTVIHNRWTPLRRVISILARPIPQDVKIRLGLAMDRLNQVPVGASVEADMPVNVPKETLLAAIDETRKLERLTGWDLKDWMKNMERRYQAVL